VVAIEVWISGEQQIEILFLKLSSAQAVCKDSIQVKGLGLRRVLNKIDQVLGKAARILGKNVNRNYWPNCFESGPLLIRTRFA